MLKFIYEINTEEVQMKTYQYDTESVNGKEIDVDCERPGVSYESHDFGTLGIFTRVMSEHRREDTDPVKMFLCDYGRF